jgi:hypothetical protein
MNRFVATQNPSAKQLEDCASLMPDNPFWTPAYAAARAQLGAQVWILEDPQSARRVACPAFVTTGRLNRSLEIPSWPPLADPAVFWNGLLEFSRNQRITRLELNSFASNGPVIPAPSDALRKARREYVLRDGSNTERLASNHLRNIKKARRAGLTLRRSNDLEACRTHVRLMGRSLSRRERRGERIEAGEELTVVQSVSALVSHAAGQLFQALSGQEVLSSILVLLSEKGAYYQSAGTSTEGMAAGASHFLVYEVGCLLQREGRQFNLGGVDQPGSGLDRFKAGFGAIPVELEAAELTLTGPVRRALTRLAELVRAQRERYRTVLHAVRRDGQHVMTSR